jgi:hypothetical protein
MSVGDLSSIVKPGINTPFHIDYSWWQDNDRDWIVYLRGILGDDSEERLSNLKEGQEVDWVDPKSAEVRRVGALQFLLAEHFSKEQSEGQSTSLVESIFREFLKNGNAPLSPSELGEMFERPATMILRTLSGARVYRGMRPVLEQSK